MEQLNEVLAALRALLGEEHVITEPAILAEYETATFTTDQRIPLVVLPGSTEEVQGVVRIANQYRFPLYPTSRGRNWSMGSRVPVLTNSCVVDLKRMNRILEFNEDLAYLTVEPGVTFQQASAFLRERGTDLYVSVIGGPSDASLVANALERGDGVGPLGDRARYCCNLEVVLPTGERVTTGFEPFAGAVAAKVSPFGLGPGVEGLFFQSNLAIVTRMTIWLTRRPADFQCVIFTVPEKASLTEITSAMRLLCQQGVVENTSYTLWNVYRFMSALMRYPWDEQGQAKASPQEILPALPPAWRGVQWVGLAGLYAASAAQARANKRLIKRALKGHVSRLIVLNSFTAKVARSQKGMLNRFGGGNIAKLLDTLYFESAFLGHPTKLEAASLYWRKRGPMPATFNPDRDRCGVHSLSLSLPFDGEHIARSARLAEEICFAHNLEPQLMYFSMSEWMLKLFIFVVFDRDDAGEEERARRCYEALLTQLGQAGYVSNRVSILGMSLAVPDEQNYVDLVQRLKRLLDPNDILAPGRYDFRQRWKGPA